jgi:O-antigen/teichoic acid export membrane protein
VVVNTVGNLLLIPHFGIRASAIMTVVSESLQGIFYFYFVYSSITKFNFLNVIYKPLFSALIMGLVLWPVRHLTLAITLPLGAAVYFVMLFVTGFAGREEISMAKGLFKAA